MKQLKLLLIAVASLLMYGCGSDEPDTPGSDSGFGGAGILSIINVDNTSYTLDCGAAELKESVTVLGDIYVGVFSTENGNNVLTLACLNPFSLPHVILPGEFGLDHYVHFGWTTIHSSGRKATRIEGEELISGTIEVLERDKAKNLFKLKFTNAVMEGMSIDSDGGNVKHGVTIKIDGTLAMPFNYGMDD